MNLEISTLSTGIKRYLAYLTDFKRVVYDVVPDEVALLPVAEVEPALPILKLKDFYNQPGIRIHF